MTESISCAAYARICGVSANTVSNWKLRGVLRPPAITESGRIDLEIADSQLAGRRHPVRAASANARNQSVPAALIQSSENSADQLLRARALSASIDAERKRRELEAETGTYMLTELAEATLARLLREFLTGVEESFADLGADLALSREQVIGMRKWWRLHRERASASALAAAAREPKYIEIEIAA